MDNLRKFNTEAEYSSATLNYPSVSWVVSGDTVHYDKSKKTMPKVRMAANTGGLTVAAEIDFWNRNYSASTNIHFNAIVVDGVSIANPNETQYITDYTIPTGAEYVYVDYYFDEDAIDAIFSNYLGINTGGGSDAKYMYMLFSSDITEYGGWLYDNCIGVIFEGTTPPTLGQWANFSSTTTIYVPDDAVNTYKAAWSSYASKIYPRSQCPVTFPNL